MKKDEIHITLHEAMRIVLSERKDLTLYKKDLADDIFERKLYLKRDGTKASSSQIRLRARNYSRMFEILPEGLIRLIV